MQTQIVYTLVSSENDYYLEELWASLYSLRQFHPTDRVLVLTDESTAPRISARKELEQMISELIVVTVPEHYSPKERSREIKTTVRNHIEGPYLFIDTDTVICKPLDDIDHIEDDIAAVPDSHLPLSEHLFKESVYNTAKRVFGIDVSDSRYWFNSGVMYVADNEHTRNFYREWNKNWQYSAFQKNYSQDQSALVVTDKSFGYLIKPLPDIYNSQLALSLKYYADAAIVHYWHMDYISDQSYSPYFSLQIYKDMKAANGITEEIAEQIVHCKSTLTSPSMPVGKNQILFLFSPAGKIFCDIYRDGGKASYLMLKCANWLNKLHKFLKKH